MMAKVIVFAEGWTAVAIFVIYMYDWPERHICLSASKVKKKNNRTLYHISLIAKMMVVNVYYSNIEVEIVMILCYHFMMLQETGCSTHSACRWGGVNIMSVLLESASQFHSKN